jgi:capsular polysaccharide biosynthesis protein
VNNELDLKDYLRILAKRIWLIVAIVVLATAAAGVVSFAFLDPVYEASTKLIVNNAKQSAGNPMDLNDLNFNIRLIDTYKEIIKSHAIMDKVAEENPQFGLTGEQLIKMAQVSSVNNSQVMTVKVQDHSYRKAAEIANAISIVFQREIPHILSVDNVSILNEADPDKSPGPVKPNKMLNIAIAFVVSLMAAVGLAFLLEMLDDTIKSERDVQELLNLPTLGVIHRIKPGDLNEGQAREVRVKSAVGEKKHVTINQ